MADKADNIREEIKKGRQDIADTRSAIREKLAILEDRVQETVETVKHTLDLHYQMKQRPWLMFGGSLLVGYRLGRRNDLATIKGAAFGVVISTLWAMAKQVLLPAASQTDNPVTKPVAQPFDSPEQITNRVITSKTNGRSEV